MGLKTHLMSGVENSEEKKAQHESCVADLEMDGSRQEQRTEGRGREDAWQEGERARGRNGQSISDSG